MHRLAGLLLCALPVNAAARVERNVTYGMYSGAALLLDACLPEKPNSMLGVLDGHGDPQDADPVNREGARVQCVVARAAPVDLVRIPGNATEASFLGMPLARGASKASVEYKIYRAASPIYSVSKDSAPVLLLHGDADETVPIRHSELMEEALRAAGVEVKFIRVPGGKHGPDFGKPPHPPDYLGEMVLWFNRHLPSRSPSN